MMDLREEAGGRCVYPQRRRERAAVEIDTAAPAISHLRLSLPPLVLPLEFATTGRNSQLQIESYSLFFLSFFLVN
jgi:hypothetical protein